MVVPLKFFAVETLVSDDKNRVAKLDVFGDDTAQIKHDNVHVFRIPFGPE
jgi:hypothetical protein